VKWSAAVAVSALAGLAAMGCKARAPALPPPASTEPPPAVRGEPAALPPVARTEPIAQQTVVFRGMCDASGAVVLGPTRFAVADDEDNVLRVYDTVNGGDPLFTTDVSDALQLPIKKKVPETDIEAATRVGDRALWLTSHGLSSKGKLQPARFRFFATTAPEAGDGLALVGQAYFDLLADMIAAPQLARFKLAEAVHLPPKTEGGVNIEGMTRRPDGTSVLIGFRNPIPERKALLVPLLNPLAVITGEQAKFGEPVLLDLGGLGVRSLSLWRGKYLIIAGGFDAEAISKLYVWDGSAAPKQVLDLDLQGVNPEAFVSRDEYDRVMLLSDDGTLEVDGRPCKKLKDRAKKSFRGLLVRIAE
jgi:hypothetical protein